jgi:hypothetical protein
MTDLSLSKTLNPADFEYLTLELAIVDQHFTKEREQHPMRRWEYAMALRAARWWALQHKIHDRTTIFDVGGAGSPFHEMLFDEYNDSQEGGDIFIIDPALPSNELEQAQTLAEALEYGPKQTFGPTIGHMVFCLSVLEHVDDLDQFCYHLSCLVAPGGLLFLTFDYACTPDVLTWPTDTYHFHWMRKRIFNEWARGRLHGDFHTRDFRNLGDIGGAWTGPTVYDYSFCSLALIKRP